MFTREIFIRPDNEPIRESVCTCAKLFVDEESISRLVELNKNIDGSSAKGPDKGKIVNKLYCILLTTLELA
jgi:hypothetical protein